MILMKNILRIAACSATLLFVQQSVVKAQVDLGIKAGISIPNLTGGKSDNPINSGYGSRSGLDVAIHAEYHLTKQFSIQPELRYSQQGGKKNGKQAFTPPAELTQGVPPEMIPQYFYANYKSEAKINYLMLPILAKYNFSLGEHWGLYVAAGPFVSLRLSAKNVTEGTSTIYLDERHTTPLALPGGQVLPPQSFDRTVDIKKEIRPFNAGIDGHIGVAYKWARNSVFIEGGGNYGFINIQENDINGKNNTGAAVVVAGYAFRICK